MKTPIAIAALLTSAVLFADNASDFEVRELDAETVQSLQYADSQLDQATKMYVAAQMALDKAKEQRDSIESSIKSANGGEFSTQCGFGTSSSLGNYFSPASDVFRKIEIRGKYVLITTGRTYCNYNGAIIGPGSISQGVIQSQ